jgi:hypothetical protein
MKNISLNKIEEHFSGVRDPRIDRTKDHQLQDVISVAICAIISGAEGWVDIENYGKSKIDWLQTFLELPNRMPSHDTFERVFSLLDPQEFQEEFHSWVESIQNSLMVK